MVIHEDIDACDMSTEKEKTLQVSKKYIIIKNHVREIDFDGNNRSSASSNVSSQSGDDEPLCQRPKSLKTSKRKLLTSTNSEINVRPNTSATEISRSDLEELKTVYKKCKEVISNIEIKYGHLLGLEDQNSMSDMNNAICTCKSNKKIVFDDNGQELKQESSLDNHICLKKMKRSYSCDYERKDIQVEYDVADILPHDLCSLTSMLRNTSLGITVRNQIINKIKSVRMYHTNEIRFNKAGIVETLKKDPDELLDFKGTNLSSILGYP